MFNRAFSGAFTGLLLLLSFPSGAQTLEVLTKGTTTSIRGLSVVNDQVFWASGSNGSVARSVDGGKTIDWLTVPGYEQRDFRDVEGYDSNTAIIMAVAEPAIILKTTDGGASWMKVFEDSTAGMFLDAMDFVGPIGVVIGDPINNKAFIAITEDSGNHWHPAPFNYNLDSGEAFFAASGTNIKLTFDSAANRYDYMAVSGGIQSNLLADKKYKLPLLQGNESSGANAITVSPKTNTIVVVGGDFKNAHLASGNCVVSKNGGKTWQHPQTSPNGYRSSVIFLTEKQLLTCGITGIDISKDGGVHWSLLSTESFHVCQKAKNGTAVFLAGGNGRIARLVF